jgi:hypothetical protein
VATQETGLPGREESEGVAAKAQEIGSQAKEQVQQKAQDLKGQASQLARSQIDTQSTRLGGQITPYAQALRKAGEQLQTEDNQAGAQAANRVAEQAERVAGYLEGSSSDRLLWDVEGFARRRPWLVGGAGVALGFAASRLLKASSENRYQTSRRPAYGDEWPMPATTGRIAPPPTPVPPSPPAGPTQPIEPIEPVAVPTAGAPEFGSGPRRR